MTPKLIDFAAASQRQLTDAARILREALAHMPSAYNAPGEAEAEVASRRRDPDWLGMAALEQDQLIGWVGAIRSYSHGWELHPLVVDAMHQRRGIGTMLLAALETRAHAAGVLTLFLGSDDDHGGTNMFGRDLFPNVLGHAAAIAPSDAGHALTFYRRCGSEVAGLLPDVNGRGKPDILMAKRITA